MTSYRIAMIVLHVAAVAAGLLIAPLVIDMIVPPA